MSEKNRMIAVHWAHCDRGDYEGVCKYGEDDCPVMATKVSNLAEDGEALARRFHETYERLAPSFGYETRTDTRAFDPGSPNGRLMIAVCTELATPTTETDQLGGVGV